MRLCSVVCVITIPVYRANIPCSLWHLVSDERANTNLNFPLIPICWKLTRCVAAPLKGMREADLIGYDWLWKRLVTVYSVYFIRAPGYGGDTCACVHEKNNFLLATFIPNRCCSSERSKYSDASGVQILASTDVFENKSGWLYSILKRNYCTYYQ